MKLVRLAHANFIISIKFCLFLSMLCMFSCKKDPAVTIDPPTIQAPIKLQIESTINDSTLVLKWTKFTGKNFQKYILGRSSFYLKNGVFDQYYDVIDESSDPNHITFTEDKMPLTRYINYSINVIHADTSLSNNGFWPADGFIYDRPHSLIYGKPKDVIYDNEQDKLYVMEEKAVHLVAPSDSRVLASANFPVSIGFCAKGDFNGSAEFYVPSNDGWLNILDAATLQLKDKIFVTGTTIGSVVASRGILYIGSSDLEFGYSNCIKIYDRATKNLLGRTGFNSATRLYPLEGTDGEFVDLTTIIIPVDLSYYKFGQMGDVLEARNDIYHGDYPMDPGIVRSFPDGSKFITSKSGSIFDKSLLFDRYIDLYADNADFAFNNNGSIIYAAKPESKRIDAIEYPSLSKVKSYNTKWIPFKIFRNGTTIVNAGMSTPGDQYTYFLVEKIEL